MDSNIIDLVSDKHLILRKEVARLWDERSDRPVSHAEGHLLHRVFRNQLTLSSAARSMNMSRQAVQKCAMDLFHKGYLLLEQGVNKREKILVLSEEGMSYCRESNIVKHSMEEEIVRHIGKENVQLIKKLLNQPWISEEAASEDKKKPRTH